MATGLSRIESTTATVHASPSVTFSGGCSLYSGLGDGSMNTTEGGSPPPSWDGRSVTATIRGASHGDPLTAGKRFGVSPTDPPAYSYAHGIPAAVSWPRIVG